MGSTVKDTPAHRACTMTGETQHAHANKESDSASNKQTKASLSERFSTEITQEPTGHYKSGCLEPQALGRTKECTQREAVIRPQQAGKIDFKSLQNRPKFSSDRTWHNSKGSPQSPSGKGRARDKSKRSGKAERGNPQQLYRLSISNTRTNPTIGIAYPQQKVTPPKKLEAGHGPISGSYRFHVPSIAEREAELQQEELSYNHCFQEASSTITSTNYTSQADSTTGGTAAHQHPAPLQQQPSLRDNNNSQPSSQLLFPEFPVNRAASWQSPDKSFNGANYGTSSQKLPIFPEGDKVNTGLVPLQFQYGYPSLQDPEVDPFPCDHNSRPQEYLDIALATAHVTHNSFTFHGSGERQEDTQADSQFSNKQGEGRSSYTQLPQNTQYLQSPHEAQSSMHCHKSRSKCLSNGENSVVGLHNIDQSKSTMAENPGPFNHIDSEVVASNPVEKQSCPPNIENTPNQRTLAQGSTHHVLNIAQGQNSQALSPSKAYSSSTISTAHEGSVSLEESIPGGSSKAQSRLLESWDGANKAFSSMEPNCALYSNVNAKCQYQCQPAGEQRQPASNNRMAWKQIQLTSAITKQNRIHLSRQLSNQKLTFPRGAFDWQENKKPHKNSTLNSFHNKRPDETFTSRRPECIKEHSSNIASFPFENRMESASSTMCDTRNKPVYFGVSQSQPGQYSKTNSHASSQVPPLGLTAASYESPLPSPLQNPASTSPCSSVSSASHSPSSEESQALIAGQLPPVYHLTQEKAVMSLDHLNSNLHHFHTDHSRTFQSQPERLKEDLSYSHNHKGSNSNMDGSKSCQNSYGVERPPPPYSAHQLLASSLSAANLDQLDVLLTCKQCDQNFNNLASFLDHKQYCGQHMSNQNNISKCVPKIEDHRKFQPDCTRISSSGTSFSLSRSPSDPHLSLLGLSKNGELISDSETKGDIKDESLKLNFFNGINTLPVMPPDLEMDDAKLDSLITEALNGLGYQSDNAEIDSSFIDAFVDDDLTSNLNMKTKDSGVINSRSKHEAPSDQKSQTEGKNLFDTNRDGVSETKHIPGTPEKTDQGFKREDKAKSKEVTPLKKVSLSFEKFTEEKEWAKEEINTTDSTGEKTKIDSRFILSRKFSERCKLKSFQQHSSLFMSSLSQTSSANWSPAAPRVSVKEGKRRKAGGGTWSKELIHKIVQQKNKPHRLHVKGTKNLQFSLVTERLTPAAQSLKFGEYDYVSDSDDESEPLRFISRGRLGHANRCKYTYEKEYKGKCTYSKDKRRDWAEKGESLLWKQQLKDSSDVKVEEQISPSSGKESSNQRLRRRNSRSSSSSELSESASISCESITSPKINDRTDSESDKALAVRRKSSSNVLQCRSFEPDSCKTSPLNMPKEPTTQTALSSHPFSKNVKRYGSAKFLLSHERKEDLPSSRGLCFKDGGSESTANLPNITGIQTQAVNHSPDPGREKHNCAAIANLTEVAENPSSIERNDLKDSSTYSAFAHEQSNSTGTPVDFQTDEGHCKLTAAEVISGINVLDCKNSIKQEQCDISTHDKALYTGNEPNKPSNYSETLQKSSEVSTTPAFEMIGSPVYINKGERHNIDCELQPKTSQNCTANVEGACLCPMDMQGPAEQDKEHVVSYTIEPDQSLIKSPLSFDTSSMFGDLTVGGFDNSLYTDVSKESFNTFFTRNDKRDLFESPPSPHLGLKDWDIITDVPPVPPVEIPHFKELSEKDITKKCDSNHIQLNLPDKIMEDSNFISGFSEDELEIKRIVTELETQLQIVKIDSPEMHLNEHSRHLSKSANTAPSPLDHNAGNGQSSIQVDGAEEHGGLSVSSLTHDPHLTLWSSPSHLVLLEAPQDLHTPVHNGHSSPEHFSIKVDPIPSKSEAKDLQLQEINGTDEIKDPASDCPKSEEMLENEIYAENLMKSLEVISDSIFNKDSLTAEIQESNLTDFLKQDQPCKEFPDDREKQGEREGSTDDKGQQSEEHKTLDFSEENSHWSAETRSEISPQSSDPESIIKTCEPKTKLCDDVPVNENVIGISESQTFNDTDLLFQSQIIEEKIKDDNILLPEASENCKITKDDENILRDREQPLLPQLFLSSTVQSDDKESRVALYPLLFSADQSSTVTVKSKEHNPPLQSLEEFHTAEENFEDASNSDSSKKSLNPEVPSKNGAKDYTTEISTAGWDLLKSGETGKLQSVAINEDKHKAASFRWNTPHKTATGSIAKVNCKRPKNSPFLVDQEATTETLYQVNMERTTDLPCQVNEEKKIDMLSQVDEHITNVSDLVNQDRALDVISQNNQERATSVPRKVNQVMTLDMITLINQVNKIPEVSSGLLSKEAEAKDNEKTELMLKEHAQTLEKEPPVLTSLMEETEAGPECAPTPMQGLCVLTELPLLAVRTDNGVMAEENANIVPQQELCPALSPLLPCSGDHSQIQQNHSHTIWANYDKLSPDSEHHRHLLIQDEQNSKHCVQPASMMSDLRSEMTNISHMDIGNSETKKSDSNSITSDLPLITTLEQSHFLLKSPEKTIKNGLLESLPELEQTPLMFSQISASPHPPECNNLTENVGDQEILSRSPKDNPDHCQPLASSAISSVDGSSSEMPVEAETALCLYSNDSSMRNIQTQSSGKSSCATADVPDLDVFHPTLENIDDMDLNFDGKKAETEKIDQQSPLSEKNALFCKQDASDNQETHQPVVSCTEAAFGAPVCPNEAMKAEGQCASKKIDANRDLNDSNKRCIGQKMSTVQEAIQCEICFACFRTVPGLKRHKAMKHFTKKNGNTVKENLAGNASIRKDNPVLLDPGVCLRTENSNSLPSETSGPSLTTNEKEVQVDSILAKTLAIETMETAISEVKENKTLSSVAKTKKNSKALKNKETDNQNGCFELKTGRTPPFSDEQLSMMKTDILQAITSSISTEQHESNSALEKPDQVNTDCLKEKVPDSFPLKLIDISDKTDITMGHTEQHNMHKQDIAVELVEAEIEQGQGLENKMFGCDRTTGNPICSKSEESVEHFNEVKEPCEQKDTCFEDSICGETLADASFVFKCEKKTCITDKVDPEPRGFKAPLVHSPGPDPELEALLDDERTFSQLFPRDEEIIRKKCTKVYGKKNKKQNSDSSLVSGQSHASISSDKNRQYSEGCDDEILITKVKDHSEYKTAFVDDAAILDMCHERTVKDDCENIAHCTDQERDNEHSEVGSGDFQCLREGPVCETATEWSNPKDQKGIDADRAQSPETPILWKIEDPAIPCPPQDPSSPILHSSESPAQENAPHFQSIDIQNLKTKFQLPDIQFLEPAEEVPVILPVGGDDDVTISQTQEPNKKSAERRGRKRVEEASKPKDRQYKCKACFTWFLTLGGLNLHKLSHNPYPSPTCYMCVQRKFSSREQLIEHLREKHAKNKAGLWTCGMCLKEICDVCMYNEHLREHATKFARKGQTQSSILGLPGCFMQETAVKNFITSIMQHQPSKSSQEEPVKTSAKESTKTVKENVAQKPKPSEGDDNTRNKTKVHSGGSGKRSAPILSDIPNKADVPQKNVEMHPNCKDPSRDCHHCGKQFPKPFKLQRHLVVHSLQKLFLCSKCPISYQDATELKDHLKSEHEEIDEPDSKHTTLYTCELCADVMHVIKKSFVCSTCNYTFSKKEQYDRHMEKHLTGGNKIFKFRGVMRPSKPSSSSNDGECDRPPAKRQKCLNKNSQGDSSENSITIATSEQFDQSTESLVPRSMSTPTSDFTGTSNAPSSDLKDADIKTEDINGDISDMEYSQLKVVTEPMCLTTVNEHCPSSEPDAQPRKVCEGDEDQLSDIKEENHLLSDLGQKSSSILSSALTECPATKNEASRRVATLHPPSEDLALAATMHGNVQAVDLSKSTQSLEESNVFLNENLLKISVASDLLHEDSETCGHNDDQRKSPENSVEQTGLDEKRDPAGHLQRHETETKESKIEGCVEQGKERQGKEEVFKLSNNTNCSLDENPRLAARGLGVTQSAKNYFKSAAVISGRGEEKELVRPKKRKEMKLTQTSKVPSSATRENQDVDNRNRKKPRVQSPSKCIWSGGYRKADIGSDYPVLSSVRDEMASNKILPKHKAGGLNLQPKRNSSDSNPPKKAEASRHVIGTYKGKKGVPGKPLHSPISKTSVPVVNNSLYKYRPLPGRPVESHSYRTAESQNNLLSQLFGQKLTSFKIPLRKDTSEALN